MPEENKNQLTLEEFRDFFHKEILPAMEARFATKDDISVFATKDDISVFATKDDFDRFVKAAFRVFATKDDLDIFATKQELINFKDEILTGQEKILKRVDDLEIESSAHTMLYDRQRDQLDSHDKRLGRLEEGLSTG